MELWFLLGKALVPAYKALVPAYGALVPAYGALVPAYGLTSLSLSIPKLKQSGKEGAS